MAPKRSRQEVDIGQFKSLEAYFPSKKVKSSAKANANAARAAKGKAPEPTPNMKSGPPPAAILEDLMLVGDYSYLGIAELALVSKCSKDWNRRVGKVWNSNLKAGWITFKKWVCKLGVPRSALKDKMFNKFVEKHLSHIRLNAAAACVSKTCQVCSKNADKNNFLNGLGFVAHERCMDDLFKTERVNKQKYLSRELTNEIGRATTCKPSKRIWTSYEALPSADYWQSFMFEGPYPSLIDESLTFSSLKSLPDYPVAVEKEKGRAKVANVKRKALKEHRDISQSKRKEKLLKWLEDESLSRYVEFCDDEAPSSYRLEDHEETSPFCRCDGKKRLQHSELKDITKAYFRAGSKMTFEKVKELIKKLDEKDMAQLKRQQELKIWLQCSSSPLKFFSEYIRWPQIEYHRPTGLGKWYLPACCGKTTKLWMTSDEAQVLKAVNGYLDHALTVEKSFADVQAALKKVADISKQQLERQGELKGWLADARRHDYVEYIKWPQKAKWTEGRSYWGHNVYGPYETDVLNPEIRARNPYSHFAREVTRSKYPEHAALDHAVESFLAYKQVVDATLVEVKTAVAAIIKKDTLQRQRQEELQGWLAENTHLVRPYEDLIKWPHAHVDGPRWEEWWARSRTYSDWMWVTLPSPETLLLIAQVNKFLHYSVDPQCTLDDVKAKILEVDEIDQSQLKRQEELKSWLKENAAIKRPYLELIRWPWVRKTTENKKEYWEFTSDANTQISVLFTEAEHIEDRITDYLAHTVHGTADLSSIKTAILELDAVDKAQYERQKMLMKWINKESKLVSFMKTVRWPWSFASGHRYETCSGAYQGVYGAPEFGDYLAHSLHVNTSFDTVKVRLNAANLQVHVPTNDQAAGGGRARGLHAFLV